MRQNKNLSLLQINEKRKLYFEVTLLPVKFGGNPNWVSQSVIQPRFFFLQFLRNQIDYQTIKDQRDNATMSIGKVSIVGKCITHISRKILHTGRRLKVRF